MKAVLKTVSFIGLGLTIIPSFLVFKGVIDSGLNFNLMLAGMVIYFGTAPFWMKSRSLEDEE